MNTPTKPESEETSPPSTPYFSPQSQSSVSYLPIPTNPINSQTEMTENKIKTTNDLRDEYDEIEASMNKLKLNYIADKKEIEAVESNISEVIDDLDVLIKDIHAKAQTHSQYQDQSGEYQPSWLAAARLKKENESTDLASFYATFQDLQLQALNAIGDTKVAGFSQPSTLVILSPDSYKHVFSRNWYSKSYKASVVERPERLLATSIGIGTAFAQHPTQFALRKTNKRVDLRTATSVTKVHSLNWANQLYELCKASESKLAQKEVEVPENWHSGDIYLAPGTIDAVEGTVGAIEDAVDALYDESSNETGEFENVFVAVRPPGHHSHTCQPSGFCLINNVHIAIQYAAEKYAITHAVVLDFDLHHGDGTQDICWKLSNLDNEDGGQDKETDSGDANFTSVNDQKATQPALTNIGYFSLHDINSFPTEKGYASASNIKDASVCVMAHGMCVWNVHLEKFTTEEEFMELYDTKYSALFVKAHEYLQQCHSAHISNHKAATISTAKNKSTGQNFKSKSTDITVEGSTSNNSSNEENHEKSSTFVPFNPLIILSAGFDASEYENLNMRRHGVQVPNSFYYRFTRDAKMLARVHSDGAKVLSLLEGGYSDGALSAGVYSHLAGFASASEPEILVDSNDDSASRMHTFSSARNNSVVTKLMEQGCKQQWDSVRTISAYKRRPSSSGVRLTESDCQWLAQGIGLGRLLWPLEILQPAAAISTSTSKTEPKKLAKEVGSLIKDFEKLGVVEAGRSKSGTDISDSDVRTAGKRILRNRSHLHQTKDL